MCRDQGICKDGNTKARTTMIELAWLWLQLESPLSAWFRQRVGSLKGWAYHHRGHGPQAIALWRYLVPAGAALKKE
jgi:transposase